jgi:UDP-GlcNAc:undecaprenyl-phosphate/decaprenyl-phosphate GlcNAc-1-phosphate transferase
VPPISTFALGFAVALIAALIVTPLLRDAAFAAGLVDSSDGNRKLHDRPVPRVGGIALVISMALAIGGLVVIGGFPALADSRPFVVILLGGVCMHVLGVADDMVQMRARYKLLWQLLIIGVVCWFGVRVETLSLPGAGSVELSPAVGVLVTMLWFVGITNAFNLIDGVDGLAAGAAIVALLTMTAVSVVNGQWAATWITLALAGGTIGLLVYNFHPASIFLGDSGSLFLGFMLAGTGLLTSQKSPTAVAVAVPVLILGLPMLDTALTVTRRFLRGQAIFVPDRGHIHHRLLNQGYSPKTVALVLYGVCAVLGAAGFLLLRRPELEVIVLILLGLAAGLFVHRLRIHEFEELAGNLVRGITQRSTIERAVRIREAAARINGSGSVETVLETLADTFKGIGFQRAEIALRRHFIERVAVMHVAGRADDELTVWTWEAPKEAAEAWTVSLPLQSSRGEQIGTLRLWQGPHFRDQSLAHWRAVATYVCPETSRAIEALWHTSVRKPAVASIVERRPSGSRRAIHFTTSS